MATVNIYTIKINDEIVRTYPNGQTFEATIIDIDDTALKVKGRGYISGEYHDEWSGWFSSMDGLSRKT